MDGDVEVSVVTARAGASLAGDTYRHTVLDTCGDIHRILRSLRRAPCAATHRARIVDDMSCPATVLTRYDLLDIPEEALHRTSHRALTFTVGTFFRFGSYLRSCAVTLATECTTAVGYGLLRTEDALSE